MLRRNLTTACTRPTAAPLSLIKRKELLSKILPKDNTERVRHTDHITGSEERLFEKIEALNLEGMVMKRKDSVYALRVSRLVEGGDYFWTRDNSEAIENWK